LNFLTAQTEQRTRRIAVDVAEPVAACRIRCNT
jgi:hypothetical protein